MQQLENERALRPKKLAQYIGQEKICDALKIYMSAALERQEPLDHVLLMGPPGLGKTTLAQIIAREMGAMIHSISGPAIEKSGDLAALLTQLNSGDILFIDEIHRLSPSIEEMLYGAMEDYHLDVMIGEGAGARSMRIDLAPFCLIGATTKPGAISAPLRDRFGILFRLLPYSIESLETIIELYVKELCLPISKTDISLIATRARGTPRVALRLVKRLRDFLTVSSTIGEVKTYLKALDLDDRGLDTQDRRLLRCLAEDYAGGPVGLETLALSLGENKQTLEDVIEPYLVEQNFIQRTARGRKITEKGKAHLMQIKE